MRFRGAFACFAFLTTSAGGAGLADPASGWSNDAPLELETVFRNGSVAWTRGAYSSLDGRGGANGTLASPGGSLVLFEDLLRNASDGGGGGLDVERRVTVLAVGADEVAFSTRFSLRAPAALARAPRGLFLPGVSYENASALPPGALAGDVRAAHVLVREDRLPLPFAAVVYPAAGAARLAHMRPDGSTLRDEDFTARIVDARLQFGSLGVVNDAPDGSALRLAFQFPGSEGDRTYVYNPLDGWANRSHPLAAGFSHSYALAFRWQAEQDPAGGTSFYVYARTAWRDVFAAFAATAPPVPAPAPAQLYRDGIELLAAVSVEYNGTPSVPFEAALPGGAVFDTSSQMGFVGRALPCAALLLYDATVAAPNVTRREQAEAIVDLWASQAMTPCGVARTWFDIAGPGLPVRWRTEPAAYHGSIRIMSDGMKGLLDALALLPEPERSGARGALWRAAAVAYADFLVRAQAADGSIATAWDWECRALATDTRQTPHAVPFLVAAYSATGDARYRAAALAAGAFSAALFSATFSYTGGAVDNPDVPDREAGWLATQAFISLYEMTGDSATWLAPAEQAAAFAETFVYAWPVPVPCDQNPQDAFPCSRTSLGASLIATGQSGADNYMSIAVRDYARLGAWLNDDHFRNLSALLRTWTAQPTDWDHSLGFAMSGLMNEAVTFSVRRGAGVFDWLPWLTANLLEPLAQEQRDAAAASPRIDSCAL